ncbi:DUF4245 domain-containing protein [Microbacterium sp. EYE_5]|uniref:DUF4245 family protein n=1 Tax=unclassified Microbacterium TaxID=2609290 RepID=UPI0020062A67|nr:MULTISPECIES: DUF4245 family protein [unclassified Microbacterium]MCK6081090.1 DUF4245 domain-containing protein [Microbacterium sp. EYE_382]MCK6086360.1 DUF4245 domain-containing protein [Microbacterium sp. EYE_384]MCK6124142.1 DUF4245 domain-containing protein [Microbacterium sp. EYE_80]MCK6127051.1 DUF4245 domain-containing protein [Microbacterium sp. EYE_79]MCK6142045.1 DUF4245 domain-containing protein [Microbacterium sp. EYE_39]
MARHQRVVAELGRPETPEETAARKAESSQRYRSSKTFRNLIAAMIVCVGIVAVIYLGVPRGTPADTPEADIPAAAAAAAETAGHAVIVPETPESWRANSAQVDGGEWRVVFAPAQGYVEITQTFDAPDGWASRQLGGYAPTGTTEIDGVEWDVYDLARPADTIDYALSTTIGDDVVIIALSESTSRSAADTVAEDLGDQIRTLREELR